MNIRQLQYLNEVYLSGSLEKASKRLYITQPALTKTLHKMEDELGFELFQKVGRRNVLTLSGMEVIRLAKPVLDAYEDFERDIKNIGGVSKFSINFGVIPLYQTPFTSNSIYNFRKKYPNIKIHIHELPENVIKEKLLSGELDIAFTENNIISPHILTYSCCEDVVAVAVGSESKYYHAKSLTFADLKNAVFNIVTSGHNNYNQIISGCRKAGFEPTIAYESSQIGLLLEYTKKNQGVCIFNRCMIYDNIEAHPHLNSMKIIPLVPPPPCFGWVLLRNQENIPEALRLFADEFTEDLTEDTLKRIL